MTKRTPYLLGITIVASLHASEETIPVYELKDYTVSVGPTARALNDYASPLSSLDEQAIKKGDVSTLGDLLDGQPGITASSYGGGSSRPIIRGFGGPRVRILESGLGSQDVSETSPDHAVSVEPLLTQRVEVLRGPATLLYGSSAISGAVNVVGREIPREQPARPVSGALEARHDDVSGAETLLGYGTGGAGPFAFSVMGLTREAENYKIPSHPEAEPDEPQEGNTLESSFAESDFFAFGGSWFFNERDYVGASLSQYESFYGVPGHAHGEHEEEVEHGEGGVALDLERTRFEAELALFEPLDWIEGLRVRFAYTDYQHTEFESEEEHGAEEEEEEEEIATVFERDGWELRAEAAHYEWAFITEGLFGIQISDTDFQAIGSEIAGVGVDAFAFGPPSTTRNQAFFFSEHIHQGDLHFDFGGRLERQTVDVDGGNDYSDVATSLAFGIIRELDKENAVALSLQRTERHPNATELYADGPHLATKQHQVGDSNLGLETAYGVDLTYRHRGESWEADASVFYTYFEDYIFDERQGEVVIDELALYNYVAVDALFYGFEAELNYTAYRSADTTLRLGVLADYVVAENRDDNENLPRIPPFRLGGQAELAYKNWYAGLLLRHSFDQNDTAPNETETDGFTELEADIGYVFDLGSGVRLTAFARANNLLDEEIRHHTSFIKDEAPRPGRNFTIGARVEF